MNKLELEWIGTQHRGIDDARNYARIIDALGWKQQISLSKPTQSHHFKVNIGFKVSGLEKYSQIAIKNLIQTVGE